MSSAAAKPSPSSSSSSSSSSLIPLSLVDAPTQRVYLASAFLLLETYKLYQIFASFYSEDSSWTLLGSFLLLNLVLVTAASRLKVPRLDYSRAKWTILFALIGAVDWVSCGGWRTAVSLLQWVPVLGWASNVALDAWSSELGAAGEGRASAKRLMSASDIFNGELSFSEHRVRLKDIIEPKHHIFGQHTIHVLPYSTAALSPISSTSSLSTCFCLNSNDATSEVNIPILFNNTEPLYLSYSITPFEVDAEPRMYNITISKGSLIAVGGSSESRELSKEREDNLDLELEDADDQKRVKDSENGGSVVVSRGSRDSVAKSNARESPSVLPSSFRAASSPAGLVYQLQVKHIGRVKLERVLDKNHYDARLSRGEIMVVECPTMSFASKARQVQLPSTRKKRESSPLEHLCPGEEVDLNVHVRGLSPLELSYSRRLNPDSRHHQQSGSSKGKAESFTISHIAGNLSSANPISSSEDRAERLAVVLNSKAHQSHSFDWAMARDVDLPISMEHSTPGRYLYELEQVKDACGNLFRTTSISSASRQEVQVHPRRVASLVGCDAKVPIDLLQGGSKKDVQITVAEGKTEEGPFRVQVRYQGAEEGWQRNFTLKDQSAAVLTIDKPGTYTLEEVQGQYCTGEVGTPWMCTAREIPPPTSIIEVDPIQDQCSGPVGVKALAILSGTPPFKVKYTIQSKGKAASTHEKTIDRTRDEIEFRPSTEGEITYSFVGLSDANYKDIKLDGPTFTQVLHPIAKATFEGAQQSRGPAIVLHSCEGSSSTAIVRLEGVGPFELSYAVRTRGGELAYTKQVKGITTNEYPLKIEVPKQIADGGGLLTVTLTSIKDAKGCERPLTTSDLSIDVRRTKPTITFTDPRETLILEGAEAKLPVRLSGEGPWQVSYRREGQDGATIQTNIHRSESYLVVGKPGTYVLESLTDKHCPGSVTTARNTHTVSVRPKPKATFELDAHSQLDKKGAVYRRAVCVGEVDSAMIRLSGHYPIDVTYQHHLPSKDVVKDRFTSAQETTSIQLYTGVPGQHIYELTKVGDSIYSDQTLTSEFPGSKIYQEVHALPDVTFASASQGSSSKVVGKLKSLCVGDSLARHKKNKDDKAGNAAENILRLTGKTPFTIDIEIRDGLGAIKKVITRDGIMTDQYHLEIESHEFVFDKMGKWTVEVTRVQDGNGCERMLASNNAVVSVGGKDVVSKDTAKAMMEVEVVETASIAAVEGRTDHCVGETVEYVLQGAPPWTVAYAFEGITSHATVRTSTFSRIAEKPGKLQIKSVAHQQSKCQNIVGDQIGMTKIIHALPSVHVKEGRHYIEDLREGNQAEIVFKLQGVGPFSFSIQRTQAIDRFQRPVVLESHTITDIHESSYSLFTADEGTWSVTWLRDRFCEVSLKAV
ncbi:hypothetical protein CBS101457_006246 [Exobasidium rhododendri]|nr:hypothetical protein CBS101457_006246 [Exobasidium rhododendri]